MLALATFKPKFMREDPLADNLYAALVQREKAGGVYLSRGDEQYELKNGLLKGDHLLSLKDRIGLLVDAAANGEDFSDIDTALSESFGAFRGEVSVDVLQKEIEARRTELEAAIAQALHEAKGGARPEAVGEQWADALALFRYSDAGASAWEWPRNDLDQLRLVGNYWKIHLWTPAELHGGLKTTESFLNGLEAGVADGDPMDARDVNGHIQKVSSLPDLMRARLWADWREERRQNPHLLDDRFLPSGYVGHSGGIRNYGKVRFLPVRRGFNYFFEV